MRQPIGRDAGPPVAHLEERADSVAPDARGDLAASVLERVADQVRRDPLEAAMVRLQDDLVSFDSHPVLPGARADGGADERGEVDPLVSHLRLARIETRDFHQILDEVPEPGDVVHQELGGATRLGRHAVELLGQERRFGDEGREGGAELVGDVGREAPLPRLSLREGADLPLERLRHLVEGCGPDAELVSGLDRKTGLEQAFGQRVRRLARSPDGREDPPRQERADERTEERDHSQRGEEDVAELGELVPEPLLRVEVVELGVGLLHLAADDEVGRSADVDTLVAELARRHELAQGRRHLLDAQRHGRGEAARPGGPHGLEAAAALVRGEQLVDLLRARVRRERLVGEDEVEAALLDRPVDRIGEARLSDDGVRGDRERRSRQACDEQEGDREAPSQ